MIQKIGSEATGPPNKDKIKDAIKIYRNICLPGFLKLQSKYRLTNEAIIQIRTNKKNVLPGFTELLKYVTLRDSEIIKGDKIKNK